MITKKTNFFYLFILMLMLTISSNHMQSLTASNSIKKFSSLKKIMTEANTLNEFPTIDNNSRINPDYTSFYKNQRPSTWKRFLQFIGFSKKPEWSAFVFKKLLISVTKTLEKKGFWDNFVLKLSPPPGTKFVIWGDLQGAYHSFLRDLSRLETLGIINDEFEIIKPHHFFIFNGDVINRSPYILETLTLVLKLMEKNPEKIFYIHGLHENENQMHFGVERELRIKAQAVSQEKIPLKTALLRFFNTLPLALYLKTQDDNNNYVRIAPFGINDDSPLRQEPLFTHLLLNNNNENLQILYIKALNSKSKKSITFRSIIKKESRITFFRNTKGLTLIPQEQNATTWTMLSCPTSSYRTFYAFNYDAFAILSVTEQNKPWIIELHNQNVEQMEGFQTTSYNFFTGEEIKENGQEDIQNESVTPSILNEIIIGCTLDLSKTSALTGKRLKHGIELRLDRENRLGGIRGKNLKVIFLDDKYTPYKARNNINSFLKKFKTDIILAPLGTPTNEAFMSLAKEQKILVLFPYTGANLFRKQELTNYFHYRGSYQAEAEALIEYAIKILNRSKFAIFYQNDSFGKNALQKSRELFKKYNITEWIETSYQRNTTNVKDAVQKITQFIPEVILFYSTLAPSRALIRQLSLDKFTDTTLMGISFLTDSFRQFLKSKGLDMVIGRVVPDPWKSNLPIVTEYRQEQAIKGDINSISTDSLEGYINTSLLIEALKATPDPITKEKIANYFSNLHNVNFQGLTLSFDPKYRELNKKIWIDPGQETWKLYEFK